MKKIANVLAAVGVFMVVYAVIGKFIDEPTIGLGILVIQPKVGLLLANSLMLAAVIIKQWEK
ncbi:MAG: hypothetical protein ABIJ27_04065 [Candidatus Omnitrophota bacterium]